MCSCASKQTVVPSEANFTPKDQLCPQGPTLPPGTSMAPRYDYCPHRRALPLGWTPRANFAPGPILGQLRPLGQAARCSLCLAPYTRGEIGSPNPLGFPDLTVIHVFQNFSCAKYLYGCTKKLGYCNIYGEKCAQ